MLNKIKICWFLLNKTKIFKYNLIKQKYKCVNYIIIYKETMVIRL
jgi:hypothetical protein